MAGKIDETSVVKRNEGLVLRQVGDVQSIHDEREGKCLYRDLRPSVGYRLFGRLAMDRRRAAQASRRPCITCGQPFLSEGFHNRMCTTCRASARNSDWMGDPQVPGDHL